MNFIEQIFGMSPDGDSGSLEILLFVAPIVAVVALLRWRKNRSNS
jgi:hypothetical protein